MLINHDDISVYLSMCAHILVSFLSLLLHVRNRSDNLNVSEAEFLKRQNGFLVHVNIIR